MVEPGNIMVNRDAKGKQEKWQKNVPVRENTMNMEMWPKHREFVC